MHPVAWQLSRHRPQPQSLLSSADASVAAVVKILSLVWPVDNLK